MCCDDRSRCYFWNVGVTGYYELVGLWVKQKLHRDFASGAIMGRCCWPSMAGCACLVLAGRLLSLSIITRLRCPVRLPLRVRMWLFLRRKLRLGTPARTVVTPKSPPPDGDYFEKIKRLPLDNKLRKIRSLGKTSQRMYARCTRPFALLDRDVTCEWASTYAVNPPCGDYFEKIIGFILRKILDWGWQKRRYYIQWETVKEEITTTVKKIKKIT